MSAERRQAGLIGHAAAGEVLIPEVWAGIPLNLATCKSTNLHPGAQLKAVLGCLFQHASELQLLLGQISYFKVGLESTSHTRYGAKTHPCHLQVIQVFLQPQPKAVLGCLVQHVSCRKQD